MCARTLEGIDLSLADDIMATGSALSASVERAINPAKDNAGV
jgi:hypothetical protein